jgi:NAD(P)-dependent dehydrogenase (short-subunit alcohol dehydrogenase family)
MSRFSIYLFLLHCFLLDHDDLFFVLLPIDRFRELSQAMSTSSSSIMKRILVTGGNKGIGKAIISRLLTEWKDTHVIMGSRSVERGQQAMQDLIAELPDDIKDRLELLQLDTSTDEAVNAAADKMANGPKLYGIVNNAGVSERMR